MRNNTINCLKFAFSVIIALFHFEIFPTIKGGYLGVEFFLIVSGYYAAKRVCESSPEKFPAKAAVSKAFSALKKIYPTLFITTIIAFIVGIYVGNINASDIKYIVYELVPVMHTGLRGVWYQNIPLWYFSAYILVLPIFLYFLEKSRDFFFHIGTTIIPIAIYACFCVNFGCLDVVFSVIPSLLRIFAGLCLGADCYKLSRYILSKNKKSKSLYLAGISLIVSSIFLMIISPKTKLDFAVSSLIMTALALVLGSRVDIKIPISNFLAKWSLAIFCSHYLVYHIAADKLPQSAKTSLRGLVIYVAAAALFSLIILISIELLKNLFSLIIIKYDPEIKNKKSSKN